MVLFHNTFVALKARCPLTVNCSPDDFVLGGERQLLQEYMQSLLYRPYNVKSLTAHRRIIDDGFEHVLTVYEDKFTDGIRLFATVRGGSLKRTPVWTAFGTDASS
jgi:hypothetical protein